MRNSNKQVSGTDVVAGVLAAVALLAMVFLLHTPLWLSVFLAVCVYIGMWLVSRKNGHDLPESLTEGELLHQIDGLSQTVANLRVRSKIAEICGQARRVLAFLEQHPAQADAWRGIVRECLQSTLRVVRRYGELSRFFADPSRQSLQDVEALLDQVSGTFTNLGSRLVDEGAADLSAEVAVFRSTLQALNEVNVLNRRGGTP